MKLTAFYDECQQVPEKEKARTDFFYQTICDTFGEDCDNFESMDKVCRLFYGNAKALSRSQYYRKRKLIRKFYDWLVGQNAVHKDFVQRVYDLQLQDVVSNVELYRYFFKDLDEALDFVRLVGAGKGMGRDKDLLSVKTIVILSWYQVELLELQELHKSDLQPETNTVLVGDKTIQLTPEHFDILKKYAEAETYKSFPAQTPMVYISSPYLMRTNRRIQMNPVNLLKALERFNVVAEDYGRELSYFNLKRNGIFSRIYAAGDDKTANRLVRELTGCDTAFACGHKELYERWKQFIVGGDAN